MRKLIFFISLMVVFGLCAGTEPDKHRSVHKKNGASLISADTMPPSKPRSKNRYYPDKEIDGLYIAGGRFDDFDMTNMVYHYIDNEDTNNMNKVLVRIDFFDEENQLRGTYDVKGNNPYTAKKYQPFVSESYMDASRSIIDRRKNPDYDWRPDVRYYASNIILNENRQCETVGVAYFLLILGEDYTLLGVMATFVMLDNHGREIARINDVEDVFLGEGLLTCDHKYFVLRYGGIYTTEFERMYNDHLRIYEVATGEIIYEWELPQEFQFNSSPHEVAGGWVRIHTALNDIDAVRQGKRQESWRIAFDIENRLKYTTEPNNRLGYVFKYTKNGFLIRDPVTKVIEEIRYQDWLKEKF